MSLTIYEVLLNAQVNLTLYQNNKNNKFFFEIGKSQLDNALKLLELLEEEKKLDEIFEDDLMSRKKGVDGASRQVE